VQAGSSSAANDIIILKQSPLIGQWPTLAVGISFANQIINRGTLQDLD